MGCGRLEVGCGRLEVGCGRLEAVPPISENDVVEGVAKSVVVKAPNFSVRFRYDIVELKERVRVAIPGGAAMRAALEEVDSKVFP